ncbi:DUF2110 family protein [Candidatus Bathyarchaeota archaeon A05DMB-2]|jgi:hypothetical protein|nr:DUF2110 family protein [Candidatus Bathyarchaeota archaeon A05DMB-2]
MTTLTLLTKANDSSQLEQIGKILHDSLEGLEIETKILDMVADRWVQIALDGEDEGIAANYVAKEIGICPVSLQGLKRFSAINGCLISLEKSREELLLDVGVFQPKTVYAAVPLRVLQAQLVDGRKIALKKIAELYGLCEDLPVNIKITSIIEEEDRVEAELSNAQLSKFKVWRESLLDRLLVLGASLAEVKVALARATLDRDIIDVEPLGLLEHALTCKLGTDAAGLIPKIGRSLKKAKFAVFDPKRLRQFLEV